MTRQHSFKIRVRTRMARTGESYATARRQLLAKARGAEDGAQPDRQDVSSSPGPARSTADDRAERGRRAVAAQRSKRIGESTGKSAEEWFALLEQAGARSMTHNQIWRWLADSGAMEAGMAREEVVIAYEQHIGRREMGQSCDGDYRAAVTRTLTGTMDSALQRWRELAGDPLNGVALQAPPKVSSTEKFRYWRARLANGTRVDVTIYRRPDEKISLGIQHRPFSDRASADAWRAFWKDLAAQLGR